MRTIVDLPEEKRRELDAYCARKRISRAEAVRRAVDHLLAHEEKSREDRLAALRAGFGVLKSDQRDARTIVEELRAEWEDRERRLGL